MQVRLLLYMKIGGDYFLENDDIFAPRKIMADNSLSAKEKIILCELLNFYSGKIKLNKVVENLSYKYNVSQNVIKNKLVKFREMNLINIENKTPKEIKEILCNKDLENKGIGEYQCSWCGIFTHKIIEHHYPVPKSEGGDKTVKICGTCHAEFHNFPDIIFIRPAPLKRKIDKVRKEVINTANIS